MLVDNGLLTMQNGGFTRDHPFIVEMESIIASNAARQAAKAAADHGEPAMARVDPILQAHMKARYGPADTTSWAGTLVAEQMRAMGYVKVADSKALPSTCVAKTAALFAPPKK